jgi:cephalosporin hydroxylase
MDPVEVFKNECKERIAGYPSDAKLQKSAKEFFRESLRAKYSYNFTWLGRPIIQHPQDILALQEVIWSVKPDCIIEVGIAHGGSIIFSASMLELLGGERRVIGIDVDIRKHNRKEIEKHPMYRKISMVEGSSTASTVFQQVKELAQPYRSIMVILDSDHSHDHVFKELQLYAPLVSINSYCVVFDGIIEELPKDFFSNRDWGPGNSPKSAVSQFIQENSYFIIDKEIDKKLVVTAVLSGFLKRIR